MCNCCEMFKRSSSELLAGLALVMGILLAASVSNAERVQVGARFPQGLILGGSGEECSPEAAGALRFNEETGNVEVWPIVCRGNGTFSAVSGEECLQAGSLADILSDLVEQQRNLTRLMEAIRDREAQQSTPEGLQSQVHCSGRGDFVTGMSSFEEDHCTCYDDNERGHYVGARCGFCRTGWVRDPLTNDCTVDVDPPTLTLHDEPTVIVFQGESYAEPGYTATDLHDGEVTHTVQVSGTVDTSTTGVYLLTYLVVDNAGLSDSKVRAIHVVPDNTARSAPVTRGVFPGTWEFYDSCSSAQCSRKVDFFKLRSDTPLKITWSDNFRCAGSGAVTCRWEIAINGQSCLTPGPLYMDQYNHAQTGAPGSAVTSNTHYGRTFTGICSQLADGSALAGNQWYNLTTWERGTACSTCNHGSPYLGWNPTWYDGPQGLLEASEVVSTPYVSYTAFHLRRYGADANTMDAPIDGRSIDFAVADEGAMQQFTIYDNWRCLTPTSSRGVAHCGVQLRIDGEECSDPGPMVVDMYHNPYRNFHYGNTIVSYCRATQSGPLTTGEHTLQYYRYTAYPNTDHGDLWLGWYDSQTYMEVAPVRDLLQWASFEPQREDRTTNAVLPSVQMTFDKPDYASAIRVTWSDTFRCRGFNSGEGSTCRWTILVDGQPCKTPWSIKQDMYQYDVQDVHYPLTITGICETLEDGLRIRPGTHSITVVESVTAGSTLHGEPFIGWYNVRGTMTVELVPPPFYGEGDTAPGIVLNGLVDDIVFQSDAEAYAEPGYEAWDVHDGNITDAVVTSGSVDRTTLGMYQLNYTVTDSQNNTVFAVRRVNVVADNFYHAAPTARDTKRGTAANYQYSGTSMCHQNECNRDLKLFKYHDDSPLKFQWSENWRCRMPSGSGTCRWEIRIDGASCQDPGPLYMDMYSHGLTGDHRSSNTDTNFHHSLSFSGICRKTTQSHLISGQQWHNITTHQLGGVNSNTFGEPILGWNPTNDNGPTAVLEVTEILDEDHVQIFTTGVNVYGTNANTLNSVIPDRTMEFTQKANGTLLKFSIMDNWRCRPYLDGIANAACGIEMIIDGEHCTDPAPMRVETYVNPYRNLHYATTLVGFCRATAAGPINEGTHTVSFYRYQPGVDTGATTPVGEAWFGWTDMTTFFEVVPIEDSSLQQYRALAARRADTTTDAILPDSTGMEFHKEDYGSGMRFEWFDTVRCRATDTSGRTCRWEVLIDGRRCLYPGRIQHDIYARGVADAHLPSTLVGFCTHLDDGFRIRPGNHTISIRESTTETSAHGQPYIGWLDVQGVMTVSFESPALPDDEAPKIQLFGQSEIVVFEGEEYVEPGFEAWDNIDGDVADQVVITTLLNTSVADVYDVDYTVTDSSGLHHTVHRTVHVVHDNMLRSYTPARALFPGEWTWYEGASRGSCDNSACNRKVTYTKHRDESALRIFWTDNFRCHATTSASCRWEITVNGQSCSDPNPLYYDLYVHGKYQHVGTSDTVINHHVGHSFLGYCRAAGGAPLVGGQSYELQVHERGSAHGGTHGSALLGWNPTDDDGPTGILEVTEMLDTTDVVQYWTTAVNMPTESIPTNAEVPNRSMQFNLPSGGEMVRVAIMENWRCYQSASGVTTATCGFEVRFNGEQCVSPAPIYVDMYHNSWRNIHFGSTVVAYCNETTSGPLLAGANTVSLWEYPVDSSAPQGNPWLGWTNTETVFEVVRVRTEEEDMNTQIQVLNGGRNDQTTDNLLPMSSAGMTFYKPDNESVVRFTWYDNFACRGEAKTCRFTIEIDGQRCGPRVMQDMYSNGGSNPETAFPSTIMGLCNTLEDGSPLLEGTHTIRVRESATKSSSAHGVPRIGYLNTFGLMEVDFLYE